MKKIYTTICFLILCSTQLILAQSKPEDLVFNIAVSQTQLPSIKLSWNKQVGVSAYTVFRKNRHEKVFNIIANNLPINDTFFTDVNVTIGAAYEYAVQSATNPNISGYVYAGIEVPVIHQAGELLLVIDNTYQQAAASDLDIYKTDLIKEGWKVSTEYVSRTESVVNVKQLILNHYQANPTGLKGVILLGHVAVPYSGNISPDGHSDHVGAWPSDMFYSDMNTQSPNWSDQTLNNVSATDIRNHNVVGDGKFDLSTRTSACNMKIFVGRVDVYNMSYINSNDVILFKQYLQKNHTYRAGLKKFKQAGLVDDNFGFMYGEAFAQNGWRNFSSLVGGSQVKAGDYFTDLKTDSYIWSYGCGGGWNTGATGVGTTNSFKTSEVSSVFTMLYGSYFGDWDTKNNFLRAPLASPSSTLVSVWGGRPNWFFHTMALGEPIGYSYLNSIENDYTYLPRGIFADQVHQSLLGDPSLKMYMFDAPTSINAVGIENGTKVALTWSASTDAEVLGYYVYRATNVDGDFELLNPNYITTTDFIDEFPIVNGNELKSVYMVKAVKLEHSNTGTFYNLSPGIIANQVLNSIPLPVELISFHGIQENDFTNTLNWTVDQEIHLQGYDIEVSEDQQAFQKIGFVEAKNQGAQQQVYQFNDKKPYKNSYYRLKMIDQDGKYSYSEIVYLQQQAFSQETSFYPNPCKQTLNIQYQTSSEGQLYIEILDIRGKRLRTQVVLATAGQNTFQFNDLGSLPSGLYFLKILQEGNTSASIYKVLKE